METRFILTVLTLCIITDARYSVYHSDDEHVLRSTFDCLYAHLIDDARDPAKLNEPVARNSHLIPYCRRLSSDKDLSTMLINKAVAKAIRFDEMRRQGVTVAHLLNWSSPIDIVERYEQKDKYSHEIFYNCSPPWFGSRCQYKFDYNSPSSFGDLVRIIIGQRQIPRLPETIGTCYRFINGCDRGSSPLCLDWREICDGKMDCLNGEDEKFCSELEINECAEDEYRCHYGGQCIPLAFVHDGLVSGDCLDGSEEDERTTETAFSFNEYCYRIPTFRCEERSCYRPRSFTCGDGEHSHSYSVATIILAPTPCASKRDRKMIRAMAESSLDQILDINCRETFYCSIKLNNLLGGNIDNRLCQSLAAHCSEKQLVLPSEPILYGFFQFIYETNRSAHEFQQNIAPDFICVDIPRCPSLLKLVVYNTTNNKLGCFPAAHLIGTAKIRSWYSIESIFVDIVEGCMITGIDLSCPHDSLFHCNNSLKCISNHRLVDGVRDCYFGEDELADACQLNDSQRFICKSEPKKCLAPTAVGDGRWDCQDGEDESGFSDKIEPERLIFTRLCDGYIHIHIVNPLDNPRETDETHCEWWPCDNVYLRCDGDWNCANGYDELNCPDSQCSFNEHLCTDEKLNPFTCLPMTQLFDKMFDTCDQNDLDFQRQVYFNNDSLHNQSGYVSWKDIQCLTKDHICSSYSRSLVANNNVCLVQHENGSFWDTVWFRLLTNNEPLCRLPPRPNYSSYPLLSALRLGYLPATLNNISVDQSILKSHSEIPIINTTHIEQSWYCNRGILVLEGVNETQTCLCPPSYFGSRCQWQSQRVSLTLQFLTRSNFVVYQLVIMLIDEFGEVAPDHEQIMFVPVRDCLTKFNFYLLYPHRPKDSFHNYSVHIDVFDRITLTYLTSWHLPIPFSFLPVNRLAARLIIEDTFPIDDCPLSCGHHGKCLQYSNTKSLYFCQCDQGYWGSSCNLTHQCRCSNDSICLGESICVCPLNKFGSQCSIEHSICRSQTNPCQNNGFCVPTDERMGLQEFMCLCPENFTGEKCQITSTRLQIPIDGHILKTESTIFVHLITAFKDGEHQRTTTFKKIAFGQSSTTIYVLEPFNIVFIQFDQIYYLAVLRERFIPLEIIEVNIKSNYRCLSINELMNKTFLQFEPLRRMKYYPLMCREYSQLMCFSDQFYMCICDLDRFSNCFYFDYQMKYDCQGINKCENDAQCFQNNQTCPTKRICVCKDCFYGSQCQFSTKTFSLTLDSILGYHIKRKISLLQQPLIVRISVVLTTIILILGLINGILSIMTFQMKKTREFASGVYILISSIISIITMIVLNIKFWQLTLSHMGILKDRRLLFINCISMDFMLKMLLTSGEWLNAFVGIDRMMTVIRGINSDKAKNKRMAKWTILSILVFTSVTHIHDPILRQVIDDIDVDEQKTFCMVRYSKSLEIFDSFITIFHLVVPLVINLTSAIVIILSTARSRFRVRSKQSLKQHLNTQLRLHKDLLLSPCFLALLSLPRLILTFVNGCMKSGHERWLFLIIYFIPFVSANLTFVIFVLPSETYKKEFKNAIQQIKRRLHLTC